MQRPFQLLRHFSVQVVGALAFHSSNLWQPVAVRAPIANPVVDLFGRVLADKAIYRANNAVDDEGRVESSVLAHANSDTGNSGKAIKAEIPRDPYAKPCSTPALG
jgi:hypothetical protein